MFNRRVVVQAGEPDDIWPGTYRLMKRRKAQKPERSGPVE
jgi:hypothetical protein